MATRAKPASKDPGFRTANLISDQADLLGLSRVQLAGKLGYAGTSQVTEWRYGSDLMSLDHPKLEPLAKALRLEISLLQACIHEDMEVRAKWTKVDTDKYFGPVGRTSVKK